MRLRLSLKLDFKTAWIAFSSFLSVAQLCLTLWRPQQTPGEGLPVLHHVLELAQTHVHWVGDATNHLPLYRSLLLPSIFPASGSFPMSQFFTSGGQSIGASESVLPMNIQDWFPLGLTGLISSQSKRLSRIFFNTTVQKHQFFST